MKRFGPAKHKKRTPDDPNWKKFFDSGDQETAQITEESLADIGLSVRNVNALEDEGVFSIGALASMKREDLLSIPNIGESAIEECKQSLKKLGVKHENWNKPKKKVVRKKTAKKVVKKKAKKKARTTGPSCAKAKTRRLVRRGESQR